MPFFEKKKKKICTTQNELKTFKMFQLCFQGFRGFDGNGFTAVYSKIKKLEIKYVYIFDFMVGFFSERILHIGQGQPIWP